MFATSDFFTGQDLDEMEQNTQFCKYLTGKKGGDCLKNSKFIFFEVICEKDNDGVLY